MCLSSHRERCDCARARVREEYVDVTMFLFHDGIEPIEIFQARHAAHDRRNVSLDECWGLLQLFPASPSDHDVRAFFHEALGRGQADPAASACDNRNFSRQVLPMVITQMFSPFCFSLSFLLNLRPDVVRQICARPPSTASSLAVMKLLSSDARKAAAAPISAGSAMRWSGVIAA